MLSTPCRIDGITRLNLAQTFECGQCFRWNPTDDGGYAGILGRHPVTLHLNNGTLTVEGLTRQETDELLLPYLALDEDYTAIQQLFCQSPTLAAAVNYADGIRVLRQDSWEALCSFIISQNNNIKRIKGIVERLCSSFGEPIGEGCFAFPTPEALAGCTVEDLAPLRSGFRAKYLLDAAQKVAGGEVDLEQVRRLPTPEAARELCKIHGVGIKVAHCALLYGFHRIECLPVDVWMRRAMDTLFPQGLPEEFLPYAGIAQQYLFHYSRSHPELFREESSSAGCPIPAKL